MPLPKVMAMTLAEIDLSGYPAELVGAVECEGSAFHSPKPLMVRQVSLLPWANVPETAWGDSPRTAYLCGVCGDNLAVFQAILYHLDGELHYTLAREFGNRIRSLGQSGWSVYQRYLKEELDAQRPKWRIGAGEA